MATATPARTPAHLWIVGVVSLLWNAFGAYDYVMKQTHNAAYAVSEAERAYIDAFPTWMDAAWAFGVWGAVLGSLLLLIRSRFAVWSFVLSLVGLAVSTVYQFGAINRPPDLNEGMAYWMNVAIWAVAIALLLYAHRMRARGVLR